MSKISRRTMLKQSAMAPCLYARHWRAISGEQCGAYGSDLLQVSDAVPTLTPFLSGEAEGFDKAKVSFPGDEAVAKVVGTSPLKEGVLPAMASDVFKKM